MSTEQRPADPANGPLPMPPAVAEPAVSAEPAEPPTLAGLAAPPELRVDVPSDPGVVDPEQLSDAALEAEIDALLAAPVPEVPRAAPRAPRAVLGVSAFVLSLLFSLGTGVALALFFAEQLDAATIVAFTAIGLTTASFAVGLLAVILGRGRGWGAAAMAISVVSNPFVLVVGLGALQVWSG